MAISGNLHLAFDTSRPCALCGKSGHSFFLFFFNNNMFFYILKIFTIYLDLVRSR